MGELEQVPEAVSWCVAHGAVYVLPTADMPEGYERGGAFSHAPFALGPFPWPRREYERVTKLQPTLNRVVDRVSRDGDWLRTTLKETIASDDFTKRLFELYEAAPNPQSLTLGMLRSDYMLDEKTTVVVSDDLTSSSKSSKAKSSSFYDPSTRSLQVEINTIASSFGCLSQTVSELHRYLEEKRSGTSSVLPPNEAGRGLAKAIAEAHDAYCGKVGRTTATTVMVVQPGERNQMDQRKLEHFLWDDREVPMLRMTLAEIADRGTHKGETLVIDGTEEVSVVYFRAGYSPEDYPSEKEWSARALVERSLAVKCPSAAYQLVGTKKVQQALAAPGELEKFLKTTDDQSATDVRAVFAGLYDLDEASADAPKAIAAALGAPHAYVLKPQREGGGNNLYDADLAEALTAMTPAERAGYILMERIESKPRDGCLVRNAQTSEGSCVAELGIYGTFLADGPDDELLNDVTGHLLRQKLLGTNEGGVAAGFAVLSSPKLVD
eukprot:CAMPEP_0118907692 /NCGR_PEP_ID=MMETSP1166-20130328/11018_1 /TAXON_ID=1104430 /ORGANISM="Chrysoreinhardia sp, Strain CCMP3193" /LENGTH=493 /DNA_ID=CAMNT_0006847063 /DNA_START=191 /DNA_END=1672 /DNA_ORIENTATION=+